MVICQQDCVLNRRDKLASWGWRGRRRRRPDIEWVSWVRWGLRAWGPNVWVWTFFPPAVSILKKCTGSWVPPSTISWAVLNITGAEVVVEMTFVVFHFAAMSFWKELAWSRHFCLCCGRSEACLKVWCLLYLLFIFMNLQSYSSCVGRHSYLRSSTDIF